MSVHPLAVPAADVAAALQAARDAEQVAHTLMERLIHEQIHEANGCPIADCFESTLIEAEPPSWRRWGRGE